MWVFRKWQIENHITKVVKVSYQVGYYDPDGDFYVGFEYESVVDAAANVHFLNGGN